MRSARQSRTRSVAMLVVIVTISLAAIPQSLQRGYESSRLLRQVSVVTVLNAMLKGELSSTDTELQDATEFRTKGKSRTTVRTFSIDSGDRQSISELLSHIEENASELSDPKLKIERIRKLRILVLNEIGDGINSNDNL